MRKKARPLAGLAFFRGQRPDLWAAALIKARPAGRKTPIQKRDLSPAGEVTDAARLAWILQALRFPAFLKKSMPKNFSRLRPRFFEKKLGKKL